MSKIAYAGPWVGEFGWELFGWQGWLRAISKEYDEFHVICQTGHEHLYQDFATSFINYEPVGTEKTMWQNKNDREFSLSSTALSIQCAVSRGADYFCPERVYAKHWLTMKPNSPSQTFIEFGEDQKLKIPTVLIHARNTNKLRTGYKNWNTNNWVDLVLRLNLQGFNVGSIGTRKDSDLIAGTYDMRDCLMSRLCNGIASASYVIGPSSGPIHLSALCGTPSLTWTGHSRVPARHTTDWNPFKVDCEVIYPGGNPWDQGKKWQPTVADVMLAFNAMQTT